MGEVMSEVPEKYKKLQKEWKTYESVWSILHYGLGVTASALAFLASSKELLNSTTGLDVSTLAIASGLVTAILTFLTPASRRKAYTEACNLLRVTRMRFEIEQNVPESVLIDAVEKGQDIIAKH